jgi:hypothetical protein
VEGSPPTLSDEKNKKNEVKRSSRRRRRAREKETTRAKEKETTKSKWTSRKKRETDRYVANNIDQYDDDDDNNNRHPSSFDDDNPSHDWLLHTGFYDDIHDIHPIGDLKDINENQMLFMDMLRNITTDVQDITVDQGNDRNELPELRAVSWLLYQDVN